MYRPPESPPTSVPPDAVDDAQLMLDFAGGDAHAFEALYRRHHQPLYRFVRRLLGRELVSQADEVFQDTWLRVVNARGGWQPRPEASFRTWLFTLAHHRAIDVLRKSGREVPVGSAGEDEDEPFSPESVGHVPWTDWPPPAPMFTHEQSDLVFWRRAGARLLECLEQLPAAQRAAFLLHHEDGLAVDELARALEVGFETAKSRIRYAMLKLRACMGAYLAPGHRPTEAA